MRESHTPIVTAEDILARLRGGVKETYEIAMRAARIPVRVLSCDEVNAIRGEAKKMAAIKGGDDIDANLEVQKTTLRLASAVPKGSAPILSDKVLQMLTVDEICFLYEEYIAVMDQVNPSIEHISQDEFRAIVDALKKKALSPKDLSLPQRNAICSAYVDLIERLEAQNSPQGS